MIKKILTVRLDSEKSIKISKSVYEMLIKEKNRTGQTIKAIIQRSMEAYCLVPNKIKKQRRGGGDE